MLAESDGHDVNAWLHEAYAKPTDKHNRKVLATVVVAITLVLTQVAGFKHLPMVLMTSPFLRSAFRFAVSQGNSLGNSSTSHGQRGVFITS